MNKLNLPSFYVGQRVVALRTIKSDKGRIGIVKGQEYVIKALVPTFCKCADVWAVDIGYKLDNKLFELRCKMCGKTHVDKMKVWLFSSSNFAPLQQQKFPLMTFSEIKVKEQEEILIDN